MRNKNAYVRWNGGTCFVLTYPDQLRICSSKHFRRATRRARNLGFNVKVYKGHYVQAPKDAVQISLGSYVLPATKK
jgi:hypothetical protein